MLPPAVLEVVVDPTDKLPLQYIEEDACLYNERLRVRYPITSTGIAALLADEAQAVSQEEHERLMAKVAGGRTVATGTRSIGKEDS